MARRPTINLWKPLLSLRLRLHAPPKMKNRLYAKGRFLGWT